MLYFRKLRRRIAWLAMVALLSSALMPALAHALGGATGVDSFQVCTAQGMAWIKVNASGDDQQPASEVGSVDHCPYCSLGTQLPALLASQQAWVPPARPLRAYPERFYQAARTPQAWRSAQPRAPPSFS